MSKFFEQTCGCCGTWGQGGKGVTRPCALHRVPTSYKPNTNKGASMRISRRTKKAAEKGTTINGGNPYRLLHAFDTLAVNDGAIHLSSSKDPHMVLMVSKHGKAYLTGTIAADAMLAPPILKLGE